MLKASGWGEDWTHNIIEPYIFWVGFTTLVAAMTEDSLDLVLFLILLGGTGIVTSIAVLVFELFEVLDVVKVIRDFAASTRDTNFVRLRTSSFLFL